MECWGIEHGRLRQTSPFCGMTDIRKPQTRTTLELDSPSTVQRSTLTPTRSTRKSYATRTKSGGNAFNNLDVSPRTPIMNVQSPNKDTEESKHTMEVVERMVLAVNETVISSKAGDYATVHYRLTKLTIHCAEAIEVAHRAQVSSSSRERQLENGRFYAAQSNKRK